MYLIIFHPKRRFTISSCTSWNLGSKAIRVASSLLSHKQSCTSVPERSRKYHSNAESECPFKRHSFVSYIPSSVLIPEYRSVPFLSSLHCQTAHLPRLTEAWRQFILCFMQSVYKWYVPWYNLWVLFLPQCVCVSTRYVYQRCSAWWGRDLNRINLSHKLVQSGESHPKSPGVWRNQNCPDDSGDQGTTKDRVLEQVRDTAEANNTVP